MELRHLRYFVTTAAEGNVTRAAAKLHVTQPGVSAQLRQLERELGQPLLDRVSRGVRLTAAGEAFLPYAQAALDAAESGAASVSAVAGLVTGHLTIGTISTISSASVDLPALLAAFRAEHPDVDITLRELTSARLLDGLSHARPEVGLVGLGSALPGDKTATLELAREQLVAVSCSSPLPAQLSVPLNALVDQPLIVPSTGTGLRDRLDTAFAGIGARPHIAFESGDPDLLLRLALARLGTAVVPESVILRYRGDALTVRAITPRIDGAIGLAWSTARTLTPAARAFIDLTRQSLDTAAES